MRLVCLIIAAVECLGKNPDDLIVNIEAPYKYVEKIYGSRELRNLKYDSWKLI